MVHFQSSEPALFVALRSRIAQIWGFPIMYIYIYMFYRDYIGFRV